MITNSIVVLETGHNMKSFFLWSIFLTVITRGSLQGVCTDSGGNPVTDVSTSIETKVIFGTLTGGYSIVCQYRVTGSYNLYLWRLQKDNGGIFDTIYTYFTATSPPSSQAGSNYASRNLSFENNNTVVFPSLESSDVGSDTYRCTIQFNAADVNCVESPGIDVNAKPDDITYQFGDLDSPETGDLDSDSLPIDKNMIITISGKNFLTSDMPSTSFIFNIGSNITLNERITDLSNGFKEFNATISYRTPSSYSEDIPYHLYLVINDLSTEIDKGIFRTKTSTTPGPTTENSTENCTCENPSTPANCTCEDLPTSENSTENCTCVKCPIWYRRITTRKCACECWIDVQLTVLVVVVTLVLLLITAIIVVVFRNCESRHHSHHTEDNETEREHKHVVARFEHVFPESHPRKHFQPFR